MGAGPTKDQVARRRRKVVRALALDLGKRLGTAPDIKGSEAQVGDIHLSTRLLRASNGEAALFPVAESPKGRLDGAPWAEDGATVDNIVRSLT